MRKNWVWSAGCVLLVCLLVSCTTKNLEKDKNIAEKTRMLGEAYLREQHYTAALEAFLKSEALYPDDHLLHDDLGLVYLAKGKYELAIRHFKKALELEEDYTPARNNLGNAYAASHDWDRAIEQYKIASSNMLYATPYYPLSNLGFVYYQKKEYDLSEEYYLKALKVRRDFVVALQGLAKTYMATGRVLEAIARLEKAAEISPDSASVYFELANAYSLNRDYRKAYTAYQKVIALDPDSPLADRAKEEARKVEKRY
jgi:tetratricopeptide (TPR) repeat protein